MTDGTETDTQARAEESAQGPADAGAQDGGTPNGTQPVDAPEAEGQVAETPDAAADEQSAAAPAGPLAEAQQALAERTMDLQRLQAEYLNYKRRVERDRELVRENATYAALVPIIDVLDTIDRAREHEPLEGGFKTVAEQLERVVGQLGLAKFGEVGDPFDPTLHEALSHIGTDPEVSVTTCKVIAKAGYKIGDRVVRAAQVLVVDPTEPQAAPPADAEEDATAGAGDGAAGEPGDDATAEAQDRARAADQKPEQATTEE